MHSNVTSKRENKIWHQKQTHVKSLKKCTVQKLTHTLKTISEQVKNCTLESEEEGHDQFIITLLKQQRT